MKLIIHGFGHMGQMVLATSNDFPDIEVIATIADTAELQAAPVADIVIDFSHPDALDALLDYAQRTGAKLVLATTGYSDEQLQQIKNASCDTAIFQSYNMSFGVAVMEQLLETAARLLADSFDIEIIEKHHNQKVDAPSGTAQLFYNTVAPFVADAEPVHERATRHEKRGQQEIGMHSLRGGTIFGEHTVVFAGIDELIEIKHEALSKRVFAVGSLRAAQLLQTKESGLYDLKTLYQNEKER